MSLYWEFHTPVQLVHFINKLLYLKKGDPNTPQIEVAAQNREWFSQSRPSFDKTTEVITVGFRLPLSVSEISFEALRVPCNVSMEYLDRSNNWREVLDTTRIPLQLNLSGSTTVSWYKYHKKIWPIVAKGVRFKFQRTEDPILGNQPYVVGMKECLIRRNIYTRRDGTQIMESEMDILGNIVEKTIKDWDAPKAIDNDSVTFWRSAPQPDPNAVVSLYLDVRKPDGSPSLVDRVYIDPVHSGQNLNVYHSSDDTTGTLKLSPITLPSITDTNTVWTIGKGRRSTNLVTSRYSFQGQWGPQISKDMWIGIEWTPDFDPASDDLPGSDPILFEAEGPNVTGVFRPTLSYDVGAEAIVLSLSDGTTTTTYEAAFSPLWAAGDTLRIVAGWAYDPDNVRIVVYTKAGEQVAYMSQGSADVLDGGPVGGWTGDSVDGGTPESELDTEFSGGSPSEAGGGTPISLKKNINIDGEIGLRNFRGLVSAYVLKRENWGRSTEQFLSNPGTYVSPDPVVPGPDGRIPSTTLDNALFAVVWELQEFVTGGSHESHYEDKEWTPIWKDYTSQKGMLFFPQSILMKYLKLEFTNLTEEPYPIYDTGIETVYRVYPVSVEQVSSRGLEVYSQPSGFLGLNGIISVNGVRSINWLNPSSIMGAIDAVYGRQVDPVNVQIGPAYITDTLPNLDNDTVRTQYRMELGNRYIYRRDVLNPYILAQNQYNTIIKAEGLQQLAPFTDIPWQEIEEANQGAIQKSPSPGAVPIRGVDWWIFPGQTLQVPASIMEQLTAGSVVTDWKQTSEARVRFQTTSVHRYDFRTVTRDKAIAYFAGVREVTPYTISYIAKEDKASYDFNMFDQSQWVQDNILQIAAGPITTDGTGDGTFYQEFESTSTFAKVQVDFRDSGLLRSNPMWADMDPVDGLSTALSPWAVTKPDDIPAGFWGDAFSEWADTDINWGEPQAVVSVNIDGNRQYQNKRVLHFRREAGEGEAGLEVRQIVHFIPRGLFRICAVFYKPYANNNEVTVRLRGVGGTYDGIYLHQATIQPPVGYWFQYQSEFVEIPEDAVDQEYVVEFVMDGADADEMYLSDLFCEIAGVRYYVQLGDLGYTHDVTSLRYANGTTIVSSPLPVNWFSISGKILSDEYWAYGLKATPHYLK